MKLIRIWFLLLGILSLSNCSTDFDILTGSPSMPVVYCVLNPQDSVFKVLLTRTFAGELDASELAQDPDLISIRKAKVVLEAWKQGYRIWETVFDPVTQPRDTGYFSSSPGCAFETRNVLNNFFGYGTMEKPDEMFEFLRLVVYYDETTEPAYSRIQIKSGKPVIKYPISNHKPLSLCDSIPWKMEFFASDQLCYDIVFKINYSELTDVIKKKSHEFIYRLNIPVPNGIFIQNINPDRFFRQLAENFPDSGNVIRRDLISVDLILNQGSTTIKTFINTYYSDNDHGYELWNCFNNAIGLFALSTYTSLSDLSMDQRTLDSLVMGRYTKDLKFSRRW